METERGSYPGPNEKAWSPVTTGQAGAVGKAIETGLERAGDMVKDAVDKTREAVDRTREKVAEYRERGMGQVSQEVVEYTRSQPVAALLIATGVGMFLGMLLALGRR